VQAWAAVCPAALRLRAARVVRMRWAGFMWEAFAGLTSSLA
jgi:hypothetical protein